MKKLPLKVFPSKEETISVEHDEKYSGAHKYEIVNCLGYDPEKGTTYHNTTQTIQFVEKKEDGTIVPGLQSEQLLLMLIDRHVKLDAIYPDPENKKMIEALKLALGHQESRAHNRIAAGKMGKLEK